MTDQEQPQHRPGTIVNGHVLTDDGRWIPISGPVPGATPPKRKMSGWAKLGIVLAAIFLLFVGCVAVVANMAGDTTTEEDNPSVSEGVESEDKVGDISQGVGSRDASGDVQLGTARNTDYDLSTVLPVKVTNNSAKRSDYTIEIAADRPDGSRITTGWAYVRQLEPGQTTEVEAQFWADSGDGNSESVPSDTVFKVLSAQRTASL